MNLSESKRVRRRTTLASEIGRVGQSIATDNDQNAEIGRVEAQSLATDEAQNARMNAADEVPLFGEDSERPLAEYRAFAEHEAHQVRWCSYRRGSNSHR